jgi:DNA polymerase V
VIPENQIPKRDKAVQLDLFTDYETKAKEEQEKKTVMEKERKMQETILGIKKKFGKNAILKGVNFEEGATAKERNKQIGGHKA